MDKELEQLNEQFGEAEKTRDYLFFEKHLADNLIFRRASGKIVSKKQFLAGLQNPRLIYHTITTQVIDMAFTEDGEKALVKAIVFVQMSNEEKELEGHYTNLRFFQKEYNKWILTAWYNELLEKNNTKYI